MGIFSFLGKKEKDSQPDTPADKDSARRKRDADGRRTDPGNNNTSRIGNSQIIQRDAARATAKKIDAIESEMTSELVRPPKKINTQTGSAAPPKRATPSTADASKKTKADAKETAQTAKTFQATLPAMGMTTDFLLGGESGSSSVEISSAQTAAVIEEAAILFANEQTDMVEQMLLGSIHDDSLGDAIHTVWLMLFDLYQITGKQQQFESLSLDFASKFETSSPTWDVSRLEVQTVTVPTGATPALTFSGKLDENIGKQLERAQKLSEKTGVLRLEFTRVTEVDPVGCDLLLATLKKLQKSGHELILVGAPEFALKIRSILEVGRRDETEAPWLLYLEILQLLNRETEFEEASIDYCVTFEVSPPAFVAPKNKVTTAIEELTAPDMDSSDRFMMPMVIDGRTNVIGPITEFAAAHNPAIIDCARLTRVDFSAAGQLLSGLAPLATQNRLIELHNVNHLVAALFQVMGLRDIAHILPRKN